jgi:hypothetical protein
MTAVLVRPGFFIGIRDMTRHKIATRARLTDYPDPPAGPGGHFGWALCGEPAYEDDGAALRLRIAECQMCVGLAVDDG